jgi:hypothetical protein
MMIYFDGGRRTAAGPASVVNDVHSSTATESADDQI